MAKQQRPKRSKVGTHAVPPPPVRWGKPKSAEQRQMERLLSQLTVLEISARRRKTVEAKAVTDAVRECRQRLIDALTPPAPTRMVRRPTSTGAKLVLVPEPTGKRERAGVKSKTLAETQPQEVRIYTLDRVAGEVSKQLVVHEPMDPSADAEDLEYRIRCLELSTTEPWTWMTAGREGNALRMFFPDDEFEGFPPYLDLEMPRRPQVGQQWRLRRSDGFAAATYVLKRIDESLQKHGTWRHGDIISASFEGSTYLARFIRRLDDGRAVVHWAIDDLFSQILVDDILAKSEQRWPRKLAPEDVEIDFPD
jgi:hypothetical protein